MDAYKGPGKQVTLHDLKCLCCKHEWTQPVLGRCPRCHSANVNDCIVSVKIPVRV